MVVREQILGGWELVDYRIVDDSGKVISQPKAPKGLLLYTHDGYVAGYMNGDDGYFGYSGRFEVLGPRIVHKIQMSLDPKVVGTAAIRAARMEGARLVLSSTPSIIGGPGTSAELVWRRGKP